MKIFRTTLLAMGMYAAAALPLTGTAVEGIPGTVNTSLLNQRLTPDLKSAVVGKLKRGAAVTVLGVTGSWAEIAADEATNIYVSGVFVRDGKTLGKLEMRTRPDRKAPAFGVIEQGVEVKVLSDAGYGWLKIAPPADLKVYVSKFYLDFDAKLVRETAAVKAEAPKAEAPKTEAPKTEAPKTEAPKAEAPKAEAPKAEAPKTDTEAAAMTQVPKAEASKDTAAKTETVKPVAAKPAKEAVDQAKKANDRAHRKAAFRARQNKALEAIGVDVSKNGEYRELQGKFLEVKSSDVASSHALLLDNSTDFVFVCVPAEVNSRCINAQVTIKGDLYKVKGWEHPVMRLDTMRLVKPATATDAPKTEQK